MNTREYVRAGSLALDDFDLTEPGRKDAHQAAVKFLAEMRVAGPHDPVTGLYLVGETGTGKSHLAVGLLREFLLDPAVNPERIVFDDADTFVLEVQETYSRGGETSTLAVLERRYRAALWVLDDLGREKVSADVARMLTLVFAKRALWPTIVTSNLGPTEFEARHPELGRLGSRFGPAYFRVVRITGRDRRFDRSVA